MVPYLGVPFISLIVTILFSSCTRAVVSVSMVLMHAMTGLSQCSPAHLVSSGITIHPKSSLFTLACNVSVCYHDVVATCAPSAHLSVLSAQTLSLLLTSRASQEDILMANAKHCS